MFTRTLPLAMTNCSPNGTGARRKTSPQIWEQVKVAYASGIGLREVARSMDIPEGTVLAYAKRHAWTRQIQTVKQGTLPMQSNAITPAEGAANVLSERKGKSRLHLSRYVVDASRTAANSDGDLKIARHVKDVAAIHSTLWREEPASGPARMAPLSVYSEQTVIAIGKRE